MAPAASLAAGADATPADTPPTSVATPDLRVIVHTPGVTPPGSCPSLNDDDTRAIQHQTTVDVHRENIVQVNEPVDKSSGLYIRLVFRQEGRPDIVWFYKTHKF